MQGAQLCQHNCTIPTKNLKTREYLGRGASLLSNVRLKMPIFYALTKKKKRKLKLKPINKQIPKQKLEKAQIALRFNSNWVFNSCVIYTFFIIVLSGFLYFTQNGSSSYCLNYDKWSIVRHTRSPLPPPIGNLSTRLFCDGDGDRK